MLYSAGYSSRATGSPLVWRIRSLQIPPSNSAYLINVHAHAYGGDSRGIRTYMPIVGVANTSVAIAVLYQSVSGSYVAEESNCGKR